jgi:hypothetical protein
MAAAGDVSKRDSDFLNPVSYTDVYATFTDLIYTDTVGNVNSDYYEDPRLYLYVAGHTVLFDSTTDQLIVLFQSYNQANMLAVFDVR